MVEQNEVGKLAAEKLTNLLSRYGAKEGGTVLVGPGVGLDAAAVAMDKGILVLASDPVTYATEELGSYAVHFNANDIFACGAEFYNGRTQAEGYPEAGSRQGRRFYERKTPMRATL